MSRRLIVTAHWSDVGGPEDVERACVAMAISTMVPTGRVTKWRYGPTSDIDLVVVR